MTRACRRRGCDAPTPPGRPICAACWNEVPIDEQRRIFALGKSGRFGARDQARTAAIKALGPKRTTPATAPTEAYARTCAMLGEKD